MSFQSLTEITDLCAKENLPFWEIILKDDMNERAVSREASWQIMESMWNAMLDASRNYDAGLSSRSGLVGGQGGKMENFVKEKKNLSGDFCGSVIARALQMGESNACMKRIVSAPTAGACGVLPAVLVTCLEQNSVSEPLIIQSLYTAAGIGEVIAQRASIAGASGGCQAEIGTASAMAAAALVSLQNGTPEQITHAAAMALKNLLGLVCDPVAGLVEVPCVKRNVIGAVNAIACADMAMAGIRSKIAPDQVIDAMKTVGDMMNISLKETGQGGLAATPDGLKFRAQPQTPSEI